ncbi:MAG TPA: lysophospholipid acyltransferase family protein [Gammaproteobacteria bacterium]|jgi:1-acyl-sn-glycerol-3-phosphate acyltransferase|nr:lysophospholipid acyltransferase family protein [Gammaproteobacteria bacterium]
MLLIAVPCMFLLIPLPGRNRRRQLARLAARAVFHMAGIGLKVEGLENLPAACIVAANHASYLDGIILTAALPPRFGFVIKREITKVPVVGWMLHRLGSEFVDRFDKDAARSDASRIIKRANEGTCLGVFPEGTFVAEPGLRSFHLGGFMAATRGGLPVVPIAIRGARRILPAHVWAPRRGDLEVQVLPAIQPVARNGDAARKLRDDVRAQVLIHCGEPDHAGAGMDDESASA